MIFQHEFETAIYRILEYGDVSEIAHASGKSVGYYSSMLNPEDPRESIWYRAALDFHNLIEIDPERGKSALDLFNYFAKRSLPGDTSLCVNKEREKAYRERSEFQIAEASNKTYMERVKELEESIEADCRLLDAFRAEAKKEIAKASFARLESVTTNGRAR